MRYIALLALIGAGLLILPSSAAAQSGALNCPGGVQVSASYICVYDAKTGAGGEVVINNSGGCSYINAWNTNPVTVGYAGICTNATHDPSCDGTSHGGGANGGGCLWLKDAPAASALLNSTAATLVTDMFICGDIAGEDPQNTSRDGCFIPDFSCCSARPVTGARAGAEKRNGRGGD